MHCGGIRRHQEENAASISMYENQLRSKAEVYKWVNRFLRMTSGPNDKNKYKNLEPYKKLFVIYCQGYPWIDVMKSQFALKTVYMFIVSSALVAMMICQPNAFASRLLSAVPAVA